MFLGKGRRIVARVWGFIRLLRGGSLGAGALQSLVRTESRLHLSRDLHASHRPSLIGDLLSEVTLPQKHAWLGAQPGEAAHFDS